MGLKGVMDINFHFLWKFIISVINETIKKDAWYEIEGVIEEYHGNDEYIVMTIDVKNINEINEKDEEQYVYPCFNYGDGKCSEVAKYSLDYWFFLQKRKECIKI